MSKQVNEQEDEWAIHLIKMSLNLMSSRILRMTRIWWTFSFDWRFVIEEESIWSRSVMSEVSLKHWLNVRKWKRVNKQICLLFLGSEEVRRLPDYKLDVLYASCPHSHLLSQSFLICWISFYILWRIFGDLSFAWMSRRRANKLMNAHDAYADKMCVK